MTKTNKMAFVSLLTASAIFLSACGGTDADKDKDDAKDISNIATLNAPAKTISSSNSQATGKAGRWYTTAQLIRGRKVFKDNCATCHGDKAQGLVKEWQKPLADGKYPAPPLNGSAHAWHHSKQLILRTVNEGGIPVGGSMPAFKDKLSDKEKEAVVAFITSLWPDKTYAMWAQRNGMK